MIPTLDDAMALDREHSDACLKDLGSSIMLTFNVSMTEKYCQDCGDDRTLANVIEQLVLDSINDRYQRYLTPIRQRDLTVYVDLRTRRDEVVGYYNKWRCYKVVVLC